MSKDTVVLFGASCGGVTAFESYQHDFDIVAFSDNDPAKWGKSLAGLPVIAPDDIPADCSVIIASAYVSDIVTQLEQAGVPVLWRESMAFADNFRLHIDRCLDEYLDDCEQPIIVYHMGKVGSTSFEQLLRAKGMDYFTTTEFNQRAAERLRAEAARRTVRMVTLVRDPVAQEIAWAFQYFPDTVARNRALFEGVAQNDITGIIAKTLGRSGNGASGWFQNRFLQHTGIDVYQHPFDLAVGSQRIRQGNIDLLILKLEMIDRTTDAIADFLDVPVEAFPKANVGKRKWYSCLYDEFKQNFKPDERYLQDAYSSRFARHFYSDDEIAALRAKWRG